MRIAVTGGTGFLGKPLVAALRSRGHDVRVLSRGGTGRDFFEAGKPLPAGALDGAEAVVNLAGEPIARRWTAAAKKQLVDSRVEGTRAVVEAARGTGVRVLISASATGYYGPRGDEPLDESASPGHDFLAGLCQAWEAAAEPARAAGLRVVHPRIGVVLHPEGGALAKMLPLFRLGVAGRLGSGRQAFSWIHRDDMVSLLVFCLETSAVSGPVNGTAPNPVTNAELTHALARAVHRPAVLPAPGFALKLALGEMSEMLLTGQRVLPQKALQAGFKFAFPMLDPALGQMLGS
jgi:uncharacterized protein (TIGR01777 family)